ncbi:31729_t:CDS:2, partial [Racocetra persica]
NIKSKQKRWKIKDNNFSVPNWENEINNTNDLQQLHELGIKLRKETKREEIGSKSWIKLAMIMMEELDQQSNNSQALKSALDLHSKSVQDDKDITDLQKKVNDLTNDKDNLDKELKQKQQQILNHKCDTPNSEELNQLKDDLKKANEEKEELERKLNEPIPSQEKEEDTKDLSIEELRTKLNEKNIVIGKLQARLDKMEKNGPDILSENKNNPVLEQLTANEIKKLQSEYEKNNKFFKKMRIGEVEELISKKNYGEISKEVKEAI